MSDVALILRAKRRTELTRVNHYACALLAGGVWAGTGRARTLAAKRPHGLRSFGLTQSDYVRSFKDVYQDYTECPGREYNDAYTSLRG